MEFKVDFTVQATVDSGKMLRENFLIGMGNPLLDFLSKVDEDFLKKWELKSDDAILCDEKRLPMFEDMVQKYKSSIEYIAGGSTQNSIRTCQWMLKTMQPVCAYMGCVGNDEYGRILAEKAKEAGINGVYQIKSDFKTGTCAVCVNGLHRSLCANLSAAEKFTIDHIDKNWSLIDNADFYYSAGFFITSCHPAMLKVAQHAAENNKCFATNLSAPFIPEFFGEQLMTVLPYVDILFGNSEEMSTFARTQKLKAKTMEEIACEVSLLPKENKARPRLVIITQGKESVLLGIETEVKTFPIPSIDSKLIVDTNGAGDAFVGGFLSQYIQDQPLDRCVQAAVWAAQRIIQRSGFSLPPQCDFR